MTRIRATQSSRVRDQRGGGGGGGFNLPGLGGGGGGMGIPMKAGGGILGLIIVVAALLLPKLMGGSAGSFATSDPGPVADDGAPAQCVTDLEQQLCGAANDVSEYWIAAYPQAFGGEYSEADLIWFTGSVSTGCGQASSQMGPFYCPADQLVYFDLDFLTQLQTQYSAVGDLAAQYIVAHEYGHHVQNVLGTSSQVSRAQQQDPGNANRYSVALELQADCYAGAWARSADERGLLDPGEISEALGAAAAVGDDRIMEQAGMRVDSEKFTHGSADQRVQWFRRGYDTGDPSRCTTFDEL